MSCQDIVKVTGQHQVFFGVGTIAWSIDQFKQAAQFSKDHGIDTVLLKTADGGNWWYGGMDGYRQRRDAIKAEGVGVIPYTYSYGNKYNYLYGEIAILKSFMQEDGIVCADMETEWNGQSDWASHLCSQMQGQYGIFLVSTWANPNDQNWRGVIAALNPCVDAYLPQQYTNYLATCWSQFGAAGATCLQPTLHMTDEFGSNDPVSIAKAAYDQGHAAISVWYHETAVANPDLLDQVLSAFPKTIQQEEETSMIIDISTPGINAYFEATNDPQIWKCKQTGFIIGHGILSFYRKFGGDSLCGLTYLGLPTSNELGTGIPGVVDQEFERGKVRYDAGHVAGPPPGAGPAYLLFRQAPDNALAQENATLKTKIANAVKDLQ